LILVRVTGQIGDHSGSIAGCQGHFSASISAGSRELSGLSVPTIQRMEASETMVRGNVDSLVKLIAAFDAVRIEMIDEGAVSNSLGRGVRLKVNSDSAKALPGARPKNKAPSRTRART
jgi:hypothetical protein